MPGDALSDFIHSLCYCNKWRAKGGKSGLAFSKTQDDRWVIKEMSRLELQALLMFMPNYVEYVTDSVDKRPTLLAKIIGRWLRCCVLTLGGLYCGLYSHWLSGCNSWLMGNHAGLLHPIFT